MHGIKGTNKRAKKQDFLVFPVWENLRYRVSRYDQASEILKRRLSENIKKVYFFVPGQSCMDLSTEPGYGRNEARKCGALEVGDDEGINIFCWNACLIAEKKRNLHLI